MYYIVCYCITHVLSLTMLGYQTSLEEGSFLAPFDGLLLSGLCCHARQGYDSTKTTAQLTMPKATWASPVHFDLDLLVSLAVSSPAQYRVEFSLSCLVISSLKPLLSNLDQIMYHHAIGLDPCPYSDPPTQVHVHPLVHTCGYILCIYSSVDSCVCICIA